MGEILYEPIELYEKQIEKKAQKETTDYFNKLIEKSGIDENLNKKTVAEYKKGQADLNKAKDKKASTIALKVFTIICIVIFFILAGVLAYLSYVKFASGATNAGIGYVCGSLACLGLAIGAIFIITKKINKTLEKRKRKVNELEDLCEKLYKTCLDQMKPLNDLFTWSMTAEIVRNVTPVVQMDNYFDVKKYYYMKEKYDLPDVTADNESVVKCISGSIRGNPFLFVRKYIQNFRDHRYEGRLVIHYTTTSVDSKGHIRTVHHTQTLTAHVVKPEPYYYHQTYMVYCNPAAPDLSFSRSPNPICALENSAYKRAIKKGTKEIEKLSRDTIASEHPFSSMGNTEFEVLFHAYDRDNERQFRLLFTPLGQTNMMYLLRNKNYYGDDFDFIKTKSLNYIYSKHIQNFDIFADPSQYISYDVDDSRMKFFNYNTLFYKNIFFDLAPCLSIPIYQQIKAHEYIYKEEYDINYSPYEDEALMNSFSPDKFKGKNFHTNLILKSHFNRKVKNHDILDVTAHSFNGVTCHTFVPVLGGDGRMHNVDVPWIDYRAVEQTKPVMVVKSDLKRKQALSLLADDAFNKITSNSDYDATNGGFVVNNGFVGVMLGDRTADNDDFIDELVKKFEGEK